MINASSTIGNGTQNGGLTISGGVTTTGNAYFAGNVGVGTTGPNQQLEITNSFRFPDTTSGSTGVIYKGTASFIHNYQAATTDGANTFVGKNAGNFTMTRGAGGVDTASYNTAVGDSALLVLTTGKYNTAIGSKAMRNSTVGSSNVAIGFQTLLGTSGGNNTAIGFGVLGLNTSGTQNTAVGSTVLTANTTGNGNTAIGYIALSNNTTGNYNTAVGLSALNDNTIGVESVAVGNQALIHNTTGTYNTGLGARAMDGNLTGNRNVALGATSLYLGQGGSDNAVVGGYAANGGGSFDVSNLAVLGGYALYSIRTGADNNTAIGFNAGYAVTTGLGNTLIGYKAGDNLTTGSRNIIIGYDIDATSATDSNRLNIGNFIFATGLDGTGTTLSSGSVGLSTTSPWATLSVNGTVAMPALVNDSTGYYVCLNTTTGQLATSTGACGASSIKYKENIQDISYGLNEIIKLRPVSFDYKDSYIKDSKRQVGFIAEEVAPIIPEVVSYDSNGEIQGLDYPKFTAVLARAVQELNAKLDLVMSIIGDGANGLKNLVLDSLTSTTVYTREITADKLCLGTTCITEAELKTILGNNKIVNISSTIDNTNLGLPPPEQGGGAEGGGGEVLNEATSIPEIATTTPEITTEKTATSTPE